MTKHWWDLSVAERKEFLDKCEQFQEDMVDFKVKIGATIPRLRCLNRSVLEGLSFCSNCVEIVLRDDEGEYSTYNFTEEFLLHVSPWDWIDEYREICAQRDKLDKERQECYKQEKERLMYEKLKQKFEGNS